MAKRKGQVEIIANKDIKTLPSTTHEKRRLTDLLIAISNEETEGTGVSNAETLMRKMWELVTTGSLIFDDPADPEMERILYINNDQWLASVKWLIETTDGKAATQMRPALRDQPAGDEEGVFTIEKWQQLVVTRRTQEAQTVELIEGADSLEDIFSA